jgi:hypothetical protein
MSDILAKITKERYNWYLGITKKIEDRFPGLKYGYSTDDRAWQIFSPNGNLLLSIGISIDTNEFLYLYSSANGMKSGRTKDPRDLLDIYLKIEEAGNVSN